MTNEFVLILKKSDEGKFRRFKNKDFNQLTENILIKNSSNYVLGLHDGAVKDKIWNKIKKDDQVYITLNEESFRISGNVSKKVKNLKYGNVIYPNEIDRKQINKFLFFKKLSICNISYSKLINNSIIPKRFNQGIYEIKKEKTVVKIKKTIIKKLPWEKTVGIAEKRNSIAQKFVRNPKVKKLKEMYNYECQINECDFKLEYNKKKGGKSFLIHVHHYRPLEYGGHDDFNNMVVLCPNHHNEFDFKTKFISRDGSTIIDKSGKENGETIKFHKNHKLEITNIESLLELSNEI